MSPLYLRIPLLDSCNSESATGTNSQMPKSLNSGFQVNCIRKSPVWSEGCGGGGKGRLTHSRWPDGFTHRGSRMQRGHQHKAHRCPVWSQILTHSHVVRGRGGRPDDKGCLVRPVYTLSYFGWAFTVDWAHKLSLYPAIMNSTVTPPPHPLPAMTTGKNCPNLNIHPSICVLRQLEPSIDGHYCREPKEEK